MKTVVWVHGDGLSPQDVALMANAGAPAVFVFDDALLEQWQIGLKRITFLYESLLEMPVTIRRGDVAAEVAAFALEHGATRIVTSESVSPRFVATCKAISKKMPSGSRLEVMKVEPFVEVAGRLDLKRFSRYWQMVKDKAFGK
jgi:hypothetical protein